MIIDHDNPARITLSLIDYGRSRASRRRRRMRSLRTALMLMIVGAVAVLIVATPG